MFKKFVFIKVFIMYYVISILFKLIFYGNLSLRDCIQLFVETLLFSLVFSLTLKSAKKYMEKHKKQS